MGARSFSFGANGLEHVNGAAVTRAEGEVACITGENVQMYQNPNFVKNDPVSSPSFGNTPGMDF